MLKRLLVVGSVLLLLIVGFLLIPTQVAHADTCNGQCGQDPVADGCTNTQYIISSLNFIYGQSTWQIRLRGSTSCSGKVWASLVLVSGSDGLLNATYLQVYSISSTTSAYDALYSSQFYSGAYTNMIDDIGLTTCVSYRGAYTSPGRPITCESASSSV